jgi:hypothetical protein
MAPPCIFFPAKMNGSAWKRVVGFGRGGQNLLIYWRFCITANQGGTDTNEPSTEVNTPSEKELLIFLVPRVRAAVHDAVMHPPSRFVHHFASAGLVQNEPVIEQAKKNAVLVRHGYPADPKSLAHARTLMSAGRGWKQCGKTSRSKESGSLHCHSNVAAEQAFHRRK